VRYSFDDTVLDTGRRELWRGAAPVAVEPQVFDLIAYLIENRDRVVTREDLRAAVWQGRIVSESTLGSAINAARTAIGDTGEDQRLIRTLPRKGFRFVAPVQEERAGVLAAGADASSDAVAAAPEHGGERREPSGNAAAPATRQRWPLAATLAIVLIAAGVVAAIAGTLVYLLRAPSGGSPTVAAGPRFDPASVPLIDEEMRRGLAGYANRPDAKALAITALAMGVAEGEPNAEAAKQDALRRCNAQTKRPCRLYAVGTEVVWSKDALPMPARQDLRFDPLDAPLVTAEIPLINQERRDSIARTHLKAADHRALALTRGMAWTQSARASRAEAARLALELCAEHAQRACLLLSVDGLLTIRIPRLREAARIFLPSTEAEIPAGDQERIARIYRGAEWRAVARGRNGSWHAVAGAPTEDAAIDSALGSCAQADTECRLYAIGNFRVAGN
jgi:DNA-binding winged helix-turn-helix (wHTH) protein